MHSAVMAFQNDMMLGNQNIKLSSDFYKSNEYLDFIVNSFAFANEYDKAMEKYGNVGNNKITNEIYENIMIQASFQSNENILYQYLEEHPADAKIVIEKAIAASNAREAAQKARDASRNKAGIGGKTRMPEKLTDCISNDATKTEIFIVEGDSAGGSAV